MGTGQGHEEQCGLQHEWVWTGGGQAQLGPWAPSVLLLCPRATVREFPKALRQRRHLPESTSGARGLPVSVPGASTGDQRGG